MSKSKEKIVSQFKHPETGHYHGRGASGRIVDVREDGTPFSGVPVEK